MSKLTAQDFLNAFKTKGIHPAFGVYNVTTVSRNGEESRYWECRRDANGNKCGCAIVAVLDGEPEDPPEHGWGESITHATDRLLQLTHQGAFTAGFDGLDGLYADQAASVAAESYALGKEVRRLVLAAIEAGELEGC